MAVAFPHAAHAIEWRLQPSIAASATYTDNANQSANDAQNALILTATPGFTLRSEGSRRVQASLRYGMTAVSRFGEDEGDDLNHNLGATGKAELIDDFLFIDGNARISQELISLFGSPEDATINDSNRAMVGTYSISPYITKRLGTFAHAHARYTMGGSIFEDDVAPDSNANSFAASLNSGTRFDDLSWALNYSIRKAENDGDADTTLERASATVGYGLSRKFRVFGTVGQDWNEYLSSTDTSGSSYSVGFGWSPTRRTSIEASAGERYFGKTFSLSTRHNTRKTHWSLQYAEDVSDVSKLNLDYLGKVRLCPIGVEPLVTWTKADFENAECTLASAYGASISRGVFISKLLTGGVTWEIGTRTSLTTTVSDLTREYQLGNQGEDRVQTIMGSISHRLSPRTTTNGALSFTRNSADSVAAGGAARDDDIVRVSVGLTQRFTDQFTGALTFRHTARDSSAANSDYKENALTASVNLRF